MTCGPAISTYGPYVLVDGQSVQSYLSAFIDVCSRTIVGARYYVRQNFDVLSDTLIRGFEVHGVPLAVYLDNGKVYHAQALKRACYRLGAGLLHLGQKAIRRPAESSSGSSRRPKASSRPKCAPATCSVSIGSTRRSPPVWPICSAAWAASAPSTPKNSTRSRKVHARQPNLTRTLLKKAVAQAERRTLPAIVYALQNPKED